MPNIQIVFLGTSCSAPTKERNLSSVALKFEGNTLLFDCPEGTQRQMMRSGISYMRIEHIFISHLHADHLLGLPGLIATMSMHRRDYPLNIYGPKGISERVKTALKLALMQCNFEVRTKEIMREGTILQGKDFSVKAVKLKHDIPCYGFVFEEIGKAGEFNKKKALELGIPEGPLFGKLQNGEIISIGGKKIAPAQVMDYTKARKGRKICYITDTLPGAQYIPAIRDADVLIHESAFLEKMKERAKETFHCTAKQAGEIAERAHVKALYLIHISPRHKDVKQSENEARMVFANSIAPNDLDAVEL